MLANGVCPLGTSSIQQKMAHTNTFFFLLLPLCGGGDVTCSLVLSSIVNKPKINCSVPIKLGGRPILKVNLKSAAKVDDLLSV